MNYIGDYATGSTIHVYFTTSDGSGGATAPLTPFEAADVRVYKNNSATQRDNQSGYTMTSPFDAITGLHLIAVDTSDNTDAGFYAAGSDYTIVLSPDTETVDGQTVVAVLAQFSIENRYGAESSSPSAIADAVCDEVLSGHTTAGTVGESLGRAHV